MLVVCNMTKIMQLYCCHWSRNNTNLNAIAMFRLQKCFALDILRTLVRFGGVVLWFLLLLLLLHFCLLGQLVEHANLKSSSRFEHNSKQSYFCGKQ